MYDSKIIQDEIISPALKEIVKNLTDISTRVKKQTIRYQQGQVELATQKHVIQAIALDWSFNRIKDPRVFRKNTKLLDKKV